MRRNTSLMSYTRSWKYGLVNLWNVATYLSSVRARADSAVVPAARQPARSRSTVLS